MRFLRCFCGVGFWKKMCSILICTWILHDCFASQWPHHQDSWWLLLPQMTWICDHQKVALYGRCWWFNGCTQICQVVNSFASSYRGNWVNDWILTTIDFHHYWPLLITVVMVNSGQWWTVLLHESEWWLMFDLGLTIKNPWIPDASVVKLKVNHS